MPAAVAVSNYSLIDFNFKYHSTLYIDDGSIYKLHYIPMFSDCYTDEGSNSVYIDCIGSIAYYCAIDSLLQLYNLLLIFNRSCGKRPGFNPNYVSFLATCSDKKKPLLFHDQSKMSN